MRASLVLVAALIAVLAVLAAAGPIRVQLAKHVAQARHAPERNARISLDARPAPPRRAAAVGDGIPADGMYVAVRYADFLTPLLTSLTREIADEVNDDTSVPDIHGSSGGASYTFSTFRFDTYMYGASASAPSATEFDLSFALDFVMQFNYHICDTVCEDGYVLVETTGSSSHVDAQNALTFSGPGVSFSNTKTTLSFAQGDIIVYVQCTSSFCLIPVDDVAKAVANNFVSAFETSAQKGINTVASRFVAKLHTILSLTPLPLLLDLEGVLAQAAPAPNGALALCASGAVLSKTTPTPPFAPSYTPPAAALAAPPAPMTAFVTPYVLSTAFVSGASAGLFSRTITAEDVPAASPVQLSTDDDFFQQAVPGVAKFPHHNISVATSLATQPQAITFDTAGWHVADMILSLAFTVDGLPATTISWTIALNASFALQPALASANASALAFTAKFGDWDLDATVSAATPSAGDVQADGFTQLAQLVTSVLPTLSIDVPVPDMFSVTGPTLQLAAGYTALGASVTYKKTPPGVPCADGSECAVENTCCKWGSSYGCCVLPGAVCCPAGCCPAGCECADGGCYC